jgi:hypothetical protein
MKIFGIYKRRPFTYRYRITPIINGSLVDDLFSSINISTIEYLNTGTYRLL